MKWNWIPVLPCQLYLYREKFKDIPVETTDAILKMHTGQVVPGVSQIDMEVQYDHQQERLPSGCSS